MEQKHSAGFSLTEISISLVVVALLMAAVIQGSNLLKSAKLKTVSSEFNEKQAWINGFRTIYNQLPGDFSYAADYWGAAGTVSGDNDGEIEFYDGSAVYEGYRAWEHLSYAEIAETQFRGGPASPSSTAAETSIDLPSSVVNNGGYMLDYSPSIFANRNIITLGAPLAPNSNTIQHNGALSPKDAFQLDVKLDDGNPTTGSLRALEGTNSAANSCVTSGNAYHSTNEVPDCVSTYALSTE